MQRMALTRFWLAVMQREVEATKHFYAGPVGDRFYISTPVIDTVTYNSCFHGNDNNQTRSFIQYPEVVIVVRTVLLDNWETCFQNIRLAKCEVSNLNS